MCVCVCMICVCEYLKVKFIANAGNTGVISIIAVIEMS